MGVGVHREAAMLLLIPLMAGCVTPTPSPTLGEYPGAVVVAFVDSGINPYHEAFRSTDPSLATTVGALRGPDGRSPTVVTLTRGLDYVANVEADRSFWNSIEPTRIYWFNGTRLLATGFSLSGGRGTHVLDDLFHGTLVASTLAQASPATLIYSVESEVADDRFNYAHPAEALEFLAALPWVDIVSLSIGAPGSAPAPGGDRVAAATRELVANGKLVVVSAGNEPTYPVTSPFTGPPWIVSVSGAESVGHGRTVLAAQSLDVVGQYYWRTAEHDSVSGWSDGGGTSLAAPAVAGAAAEALHLLRQAGADPRPADLRPHLNATAVYWNATDYAPGIPTTLGQAGSASTPILLPWQQMGWGYIGPEHAAAIAQAYLGTLAPPPKPPEAVAYMEAQQDAREAYWAGRVR
jgi:hypothetical protein